MSLGIWRVALARWPRVLTHTYWLGTPRLEARTALARRWRLATLPAFALGCFKPVGAAAVILDAAGRVLLVKHNYGRLNWEIPGGGAEPRESAAETAVREVQEETGLAVVAERLVAVYYEPAIDMHYFLFVCRPVDPEAVPKADPSEATDCGYWLPDALPRPISDFTVRRIQDALSGATLSLPVPIGSRQWLE